MPFGPNRSLHSPRRRLRNPEAPLHARDDLEGAPLQKAWLETPPGNGNGVSSAGNKINCGVEGCSAVLQSAKEYEMHYETAHRHRCATCARVFLNARHLSLHVSERHDAFFELLSRRKPMYECLVEGCKTVSESRSARQAHLLAKHKFPPSYRFDEAATDGKAPPNAQTVSMETCEEVESGEGTQGRRPERQRGVPSMVRFGSDAKGTGWAQ